MKPHEGEQMTDFFFWGGGELYLNVILEHLETKTEVNFVLLIKGFLYFVAPSVVST